MHLVDRGLWCMLFAPNRGRHGTTLAVDRNNVELIASRTLNRCNIESEDISRLVSAFHMDWCAAMMTSHTSPSIVLADLANLGIPCSGNQRDTLTRTESLGVAKLHLGRPNGTCDVHPVVVSGSLQGLPGIDRPIRLFLFLAIVVGYLLCRLALGPLPLAFLLRLLLVGNLWWLNEVMLRVLNRAKNTLVMLLPGQYTNQRKDRKGFLTIDNCGLLSLRHISQVHLPGARLSMTP